MVRKNLGLVFEMIDKFFDKETISKKDEIVFTFGRRIYTMVTKVLEIMK